MTAPAAYNAAGASRRLRGMPTRIHFSSGSLIDVDVDEKSIVDDVNNGGAVSYRTNGGDMLHVNASQITHWHTAPEPVKPGVEFIPR